MMDIPKLLQELDDIVAMGLEYHSASWLLSLCKQSAAAIRELQAENARGMKEEHARFLLQLGDGISTLGKRMQGHA